MVGHAWPQAFAFRPHYEHYTPLVVRFVVPGWGIRSRTVDPRFSLLGPVEEVGQVADLRHRQILDSTGRGLAGGRSYLRGPTLRDHEARGAGAFGHAGD